MVLLRLSVRFRLFPSSLVLDKSFNDNNNSRFRIVVIGPDVAHVPPDLCGVYFSGLLHLRMLLTIKPDINVSVYISKWTLLSLDLRERSSLNICGIIGGKKRKLLIARSIFTSDPGWLLFVLIAVFYVP